jgi:hypothetical protein
MSLKKIFPLVLAGALLVGTYIVLLPPPSERVVIATRDLKAGYVIQEGDVELEAVSADRLPLDVVGDKSLVIGQALRIDRGQGDIIRASQLGTLVDLSPNERGVSVSITDASGLSGVLTPGQKVGVIASIPREENDTTGTFSKATVENLRVLFIDPAFAANMSANVVPSAATPMNGDLLGGIQTDDRARVGSVLLAVPVNLQVIFYDFSATGAISESRSVNALELLGALQNMEGAMVTLYLMPGESSEAFTSPGLWLPDLIRTPLPTATPTTTPNMIVVTNELGTPMYATVTPLPGALPVTIVPGTVYPTP